MTDPVDDCLICFRKTQIYRKHIKPYNCTCNYPVHRACFEKWQATGTRKLCLFCQLETPEPIPPMELDLEDDLIVQGEPIEVQPRQRLHGCCESMYMVFYIFGFLILYVWVFYIRR